MRLGCRRSRRSNRETRDRPPTPRRLRPGRRGLRRDPLQQFSHLVVTAGRARGLFGLQTNRPSPRRRPPRSPGHRTASREAGPRPGWRRGAWPGRRRRCRSARRRRSGPGIETRAHAGQDVIDAVWRTECAGESPSRSRAARAAGCSRRPDSVDPSSDRISALRTRGERPRGFSLLPSLITVLMWNRFHHLFCDRPECRARARRARRRAPGRGPVTPIAPS